jgi:hypothetical protein
MAWLTAGVGVKPSPVCTRACTPWAASTSKAVSRAGTDSACVSMPTNTGPVTPCSRRYSTKAWVTARMWFSLKAVLREEPR